MTQFFQFFQFLYFFYLIFVVEVKTFGSGKGLWRPGGDFCPLTNLKTQLMMFRLVTAHYPLHTMRREKKRENILELFRSFLKQRTWSNSENLNPSLWLQQCSTIPLRYAQCEEQVLKRGRLQLWYWQFAHSRCILHHVFQKTVRSTLMKGERWCLPLSSVYWNNCWFQNKKPEFSIVRFISRIEPVRK